MGKETLDIAEFRPIAEALGYRPKAIFPSEMFVFCQLYQEHGCNLTLESGVGFGGSTSTIANMFPDNYIVSFCLDKYDQIDSIRKQFKGKKVEIFGGDSQELMPQFLNNLAGERIAVLIDGPKGKPAIDLAMRMLQDEQVKFVAIHDLADELAEMGDFTTKNEYFQSNRDELDSDIGSYKDKYPKGPGLTFIINE